MNRDHLFGNVFTTTVAIVAALAITMVACQGQTPRSADSNAPAAPAPTQQNQSSIGTITTHDLLHDTQGCEHVIDLIVRHGVNRASPLKASQRVAYLGHAGPIMIPICDLGDLEVVSVFQHQASASTSEFCITLFVRNNSTREVGPFAVTAVAVLGVIDPWSPAVTKSIEKISAGQTVQVPMSLPPRAMAMGSRKGQPVAFDKLVVAVDSFDQWVESDEANNLKAWPAKEIPVFPTLSAETSVTIGQQNPSAAPGVAPETAPVQNPIRSAIESLQQSQSPDSGTSSSSPASVSQP